MTRQDWVGSGGSVPEVGSEGSGPEGRDAKSPGRKVDDSYGGDEDIDGIAVEAGWGSCADVYTRLATLESKVDFFLKFYSAASLYNPIVNCTYLYWSVQDRTGGLGGAACRR